MPEPLPQLSYITLAVSDLPRATAFCEALLGLPARPGPAGVQVAFFPLGALTLALFPRESLAREANFTPGDPGAVALSLNVPDETALQILLERAIAAGATVTRLLHTTPWSARAAWFTDPEGHLWELSCKT
jgi:catechol 2,3-dioxygenase-like lactoylglutathione lyase family enzyme